MPRRKEEDINHSDEEAVESHEVVEDEPSHPIVDSEEEGDDLLEDA
jgi:hypothetical protein